MVCYNALWVIDPSSDGANRNLNPNTSEAAFCQGGLMNKTICELFAGVGGFRLGFEKLNSGWETTWFSQWEPGARTQRAHDCFVNDFGE